MKNLYNFLFHYNPHMDLWEAVKREHYRDLFSDAKSDKILRSRYMKDLVDLIRKTNGETEKIKQLTSA